MVQQKFYSNEASFKISFKKQLGTEHLQYSVVQSLKRFATLANTKCSGEAMSALSCCRHKTDTHERGRQRESLLILAREKPF